MRFLYSLAWWLISPILLLLLLSRAVMRPAYRKHWPERFGFCTGDEAGRIWIHAVSVGETRAAQPLIQALLARDPSSRFLLTHMTPTGRATGETLYANLIKSGQLKQSYLPYDYAWAMRRFLRHWRPAIGLVMETEIWPNLMAIASELELPMCLINARLSEKSLRKGLRLQSLMSPAVSGFACIVAQSVADARRIEMFRPKGAVAVSGSTKFDVQVSEEQVLLGRSWKQSIQRPIVLFASSREGEEAMFFDAAKRSFASGGSDVKPLLLVVPRHPERFAEVAKLALDYKFSIHRRSEGIEENLPMALDVLIGDSMGEMMAYYQAADVAIIGGSFGEYGSQNLLEAMALGKPTIVGPSQYNFDHIIREALASGGAVGVSDMTHAFVAALGLLSDANKVELMGRSAQQFCQLHQGATHKTLAAISQWLPKVKAMH
jgi:3-deoxy-D-manno-octulosonic-acid transferase